MAGAAKRDVDLSEIALANSLLPWRVVDISLRPYAGMYSFNPSIHFDGQTWRCSLRCADYGMPGGRVVRSAGARARVQSRAAMLILDPDSWKASGVYLMHEHDGMPRNTQCASVGFEDLRLFSTSTQDGERQLWAIAASLHLHRDGKGTSTPPEQVVLALDDEYAIVGAQPIRGPWSNAAQKNWMPFDGAAAPRFLFSIERGIVFTLDGPERATRPELAPLDHALKNVGGTEVRMMRRPFKTTSGKVTPPTYDGMRGGSQLLPIDSVHGAYLGIAHEMRYVRGQKFYWHTFFTCDTQGKLEKVSPPIKLCAQGIEFAAGMAIDGDRLVVSFGVDDSECKLAITSLSAVLEMLRPVPAAQDDGGKDAARAGRVYSDTVKTFDPRIPRVYASVGIDPQRPVTVPAPRHSGEADAAADHAMAAVLDGAMSIEAARAIAPPAIAPSIANAVAGVLLDAAREAARAQRDPTIEIDAYTAAQVRLADAVRAYGDCFFDERGQPR